MTLAIRGIARPAGGAAGPVTDTVVHYTDTHAFGGTERMLLALLADTDRRRWRPVLYHHAGAGVARLVAGAEALGVPTRCVPRMHRRRGIAELPRFARLLRAERAAVFHAHLTWPLRCTHALLGARLAGVPAIIATQQLFCRLPTRRAALLHRLVSTVVDRYIAVSGAMARELESVCAGGLRRVDVVRNSALVAEFDRAPAADLRAALAGTPARPVVLTLARLDWQKGLDTLIAAAALVPDAMFVVAGDGTQRAALEAQARSLGVSDRLRLLGHREDVADLLAACDLFVLPSVLEGFPVSVVEAMAAGKAVVATAVGGTQEAVIDGETGLLVPPRVAGALAAAIRRVLDDPALAVRLGEAGRARARREFSRAHMVERTTQVYEQLLACRRGAA